MSVQPKSRSFFSTTAGLVTGIAGVLTAVVGLLGLAAQQGWIGSQGDSDEKTTTTNPSQTTLTAPLGGVLPTTTAPGGAVAPGATSAAARFNVTPAEVDFSRLSTRETFVKIENVGTNAIPFDAPTVSGPNRTNFTATPVDSSCTRLDPNRSCQIKVTFAPPGAGQYSATLVIDPTGAPPAKEVALKGSALI